MINKKKPKQPRPLRQFDFAEPRNRENISELFNVVKDCLHQSCDIELFVNGDKFAVISEGDEFLYLNDDVYDRDDFGAFAHDLRKLYSQTKINKRHGNH